MPNPVSLEDFVWRISDKGVEEALNHCNPTDYPSEIAKEASDAKLSIEIVLAKLKELGFDPYE